MNPSPPVEVRIIESNRLKRASATLRQGMIQIKLPQHWSKPYKKSVILNLTQRVLNRTSEFQQLVAACRETAGPFITLATQEEVHDFVHSLNRQTFNAPLKGVRIGQARYTRLAQVNIQTGIMTISKYSLHQVPLSALRYLIIHELAHFSELGHGPRFWRLVAQYVPDYRAQSRLMKLFHQHALEQGEEAQTQHTDKKTAKAAIEAEIPEDRLAYQLRLSL